MPKANCTFVTKELQVNLSTVNDFCKVGFNFPTVEDRLKSSGWVEKDRAEIAASWA